MAGAALVFVDCETTGLDPDRHDVWEIALIRREPGTGNADTEYVYRLKPDLGEADPGALRLTRFYERTSDEKWSWSGAPAKIARWVAEVTAGAHLVGAVPWFDAAFLERLLGRWDLRPAWHYHLVDVEALAVGCLANSGGQFTSWHEIGPPWQSDVLSRAVGVSPDEFERHTALGDAMWARAIYDQIMGS